MTIKRFSNGNYSIKHAIKISFWESTFIVKKNNELSYIKLVKYDSSLLNQLKTIIKYFKKANRKRNDACLFSCKKQIENRKERQNYAN